MRFPKSSNTMAITPTRHEISDLTVCRAIFAAWVFTYHVNLHAHFSAYLGLTAELIRRGYLGVDGFFLLSGLILARVHPALTLSSAGALRFWGKRLARIYPVHLAVLILLALIAATGLALGIVPHDPGRFSLTALGQDLLLIQAWGVANQLAWNYPSWSISTEWAGYLLFPVLAYAIARCPKMPAICLLILCLPVLALVDHRSAQGLNLTFAHSLWRFFPEFIAGILTARLMRDAAPRMPYPLLVAAGAAVVIGALLLKTDPGVVAGLWLLIAALAGQANAGHVPVFANFRLPRFLGILSYAFYMSFATVELVLAQICDHEGWNPADHKLAYAAAMTLLTFALALTLHHLVEKPCRRLFDRRLERNAPLAAEGVRL